MIGFSGALPKYGPYTLENLGLRGRYPIQTPHLLLVKECPWATPVKTIAVSLALQSQFELHTFLEQAFKFLCPFLGVCEGVQLDVRFYSLRNIVTSLWRDVVARLVEERQCCQTCGGASAVSTELLVGRFN
jgi:hypothetical protein